MKFKYLDKLYHNMVRLIPPRFRPLLRNLLVTCKIKPSLISALIALTYHCNGICHKCSISKYRKNGKELDTEEVKSLIDQLYSIKTGKIGFFGGESLLRKDIYELIAYATKKGIKTEVFTNGYLLSQSVVKKLKGAGLSNISISLDSSDAKVHDKLRKLPNCFKRAIKGIEYCIRNGISIEIITVATKENSRNGDLERIISLGKRLKVNNIQLLPPTMIGRWFNAKKELLEPQDYDKIISLKKSSLVVSEVETTKKSVHRYCLSKMRALIYISPYGDVQPCWSVPVSFGNVREKPLKDIFKLIKTYKFNTHSYDCLANDPEFRAEYLKRIKPGTSLPIKMY